MDISQTFFLKAQQANYLKEILIKITSKLQLETYILKSTCLQLPTTTFGGCF